MPSGKGDSVSDSTGRRRTTRQRNVTPYSCSTRRRQKRGVSPDFMSEHVPTTDELKVITGILSKTWVLHQLSPLWKFTSSSLTVYSKLLSQHIASQDKDRGKGTSVKLSSLARFGRDGSEGIEIAVTLTGGSRLFTAILCTMSQRVKLKKGFTSLPLLLSQGDPSISRLVFDWLQTTFDAHLSPYILEQDDLSLLLAQYACTEKVGRGVSSVELVYETTESVKRSGLSTVALELPWESALTLWDSVNKVERTASDVMRTTSQQREKFIQALKGYLEQHFNLKMETLKLTRITTPVLHVEKSGKIKFQSLSCVIPVLSVLQERQGTTQT